MQWLSVKKYSPIQGVDYLTCFKNAYGVTKLLLARYSNYGWADNSTCDLVDERIEITHFAVIPPVEIE